MDMRDWATGFGPTMLHLENRALISGHVKKNHDGFGVGVGLLGSPLKVLTNQLLISATVTTLQTKMSNF
ncbi:hypothetical protein L484_000030 [Morus notabilis]|uniref:Uncharacterized protein n=1 Tax=Morus notabilis TaxID=981085 RepID=W9SL25_9ROSA|nr:hypothetical protein L484_000030 [Morus notabilis]